jgi:hypothetical protein
MPIHFGASSHAWNELTSVGFVAQRTQIWRAMSDQANQGGFQIRSFVILDLGVLLGEKSLARQI